MQYKNVILTWSSVRDGQRLKVTKQKQSTATAHSVVPIYTTYHETKNILTFPILCRGQLKCDGTRAETRFRLSAKRRSPLKSAGASVHSTTGSRGVPISGSNAGYTVFRGSAKSTGYPLHSPVSPSLPFPCVTVCHHISTGVYLLSVLERTITFSAGSINRLTFWRRNYFFNFSTSCI